MKLKVANLPAQKLAFSNLIYVKKETFQALASRCPNPVPGDKLPVTVKSSSAPDTWYFTISHCSDTNVFNGEDVGMNNLQRKSASLTLAQEVEVEVFLPSAAMAISVLYLECDFLKKGTTGDMQKIDITEFSAAFQSTFDQQIFKKGQQLAFNCGGKLFEINVTSVENVSLGNVSVEIPRDCGQFVSSVSVVNPTKRNGSTSPFVFLAANATRNDNMFRQDFDFEKLGIGGLGKEFQEIFQRAFASRIFPGLVKELGINHVRGLLLYGPPGCGKTLIARQIGKALNSRQPKIVNGPEILDKYVGGSEEKIRELFAEAEKEQAEMGDKSMLHIIIFDEMDAIMKTRGSTRDGTGVQDSIVNQLLSKIDGVDSLNNILIIGMTNRKDMLDEAILRPGRLEVHVEIGLPDEHGRLQIINIHTSSMRKNKRITDAALAYLPELAAKTKNYTGAEIEGLIRYAASFALTRNINFKEIKAADESSVLVDILDFEKALEKTIPAFGQLDGSNLKSLVQGGMYDYGRGFTELKSSLDRVIKQLRTSSRTSLLTVLLEGPSGTGKTALAAQTCLDSDFSFVRMISPDTMIGQSESQKCQTLLKTFTDAYRSDFSIIFIDDIERLIEYTPIGHRFSNIVLQTLMVLLKKRPPVEGKKLLVIATSAISDFLQDLQLIQAFSLTLHCSTLQSVEEYKAVLEADGGYSPEEITEISTAVQQPIGIKQLLMVLEMARATSTNITSAEFLECLNICGF